MNECALVCMKAHERLCYCRCGGANHGHAKEAFAGYFCEDCGLWFGTSVKAVWYRGAYMMCGTSKKYRGKFLNNTAAYYCDRCSAKRYPKETEDIARTRAEIGLWP